MKKLILVDVSAMYFRAFYAIRQLSNSKGMPTNALYGFLSMSMKLFEKFNPEYLAFCFDRKEPSFRKKIYDNYKANRTEMPEDLVPQVPYIEKIAKAIGAPCFSLENYEADDVIGMLAKFGCEQGLQVIIVSGDKDFAQLVNEHVHMYEPMKEVYLEPNDVIAKFGVKPEQIRDYLALVGDSSDNVPGVRGIGPKGAQKLISEFGSIEGLFDNIKKVANKKLQEKLIEAKDDAFLSKELVTIVTENLLDIQDLQPLVRKDFHKEELKALLIELEFGTLLRKLFPEEAPATSTTKKSAAKKKKLEKASAVLVEDASVGLVPKIANAEIEKHKIKAEFIEARILEGKLDPKKDLWAYIWNNYLCFGQKNHLYVLQEPSYDLKFLNSKDWKWKGFDLKSVWRLLKLEHVQVDFDLQLALYTYTSNAVVSLNEVFRTCFDDPNPILDDIARSYAAILCLEPHVMDLLKQTHVEPIYKNIELPVAPILHQMESRGICLNLEELKRQSESLKSEIQTLNKMILDHLKSDINLDSPKQLANLLFEVHKMPVLKKTKTGYSTDSDVLAKLAVDYPIAGKITEYRELKKLATTYVDALPKLCDPKTKKIHTNFNQAVASTGRLSSSNPNLQNIPIRTERGNMIRSAFVAGEGNMLISADYSQIELRILAHITDDPALIRAFNEDVDIHALTASEVFGVSLDKVDGEMRRRAKAVNFGIAYGMGAYSLAENLNIPRAEAKAIIDTYFDRFKNVKLYMKRSIEQAKEQGYVESIFGRRRYIPEIYSKNQNIMRFGERIAINSPMQSSASDIVKKAMIEVETIPFASMLLQVHDELIVETSEARAEEVAHKIQKTMESITSLKVKLKVNVGWAKSWKDA